MTISHSAIIGNSIRDACRHLNNQEVVAIPTETVYGLAGNALEDAAVIKIFEVKNRPSFDPLIVHCFDFKAFENYAFDISKAAENLYNAVGPGPVTYILNKKPIISDLVSSGLPTVGLRVPNHPLTLKLLRALPYPLAAPSANPFGYVSPTTAWHVNAQLGKKIPYILNGGACTIGIESTIVDFTQDVPVVLRLGGLAIEFLQSVLGESIVINTTSTSQPAAPGMLHSHYAPSKPLFLENKAAHFTTLEFETLGYLGFDKRHPQIPQSQQLLLSPNGDLSEAAKNLFAHLRAFENLPISGILAANIPERGLGRGINDRLRRAAFKST
ncbi:MAG: threonylcarbamoyl-AMP synthase [Schleiferiaceae bacterium]|nr:threonylcarbamoyl-AMP synthase [Schleiferiaceae bacterium]